MIQVRHGVLLLAPLVVVLAAFFLAPVLMMLPTSFREYTPGVGLVPGVWTLENYIRIVADDYYREVIWRTLGLGLSVSSACLLLGYPLAYLIVRGPERPDTRTPSTHGASSSPTPTWTSSAGTRTSSRSRRYGTRSSRPRARPPTRRRSAAIRTGRKC